MSTAEEPRRGIAGVARQAWAAMCLVAVCIAFTVASVVAGARPPVDPLNWASWEAWYHQDPRSAVSLVFAAFGATIGIVIGVYQVFFDRKIDREAGLIRQKITEADEESARRDAGTAASLAEIKSLVSATLEKQASYPTTLNIGSVGAVLSATGNICVVHDAKLPDYPLLFVYNAKTRALTVLFADNSNYLFSWRAEDQFHERLVELDHILMVRMENRHPVEGNNVPLSSVDGNVLIVNDDESPAKGSETMQ